MQGLDVPHGQTKVVEDKFQKMRGSEAGDTKNKSHVHAILMVNDQRDGIHLVAQETASHSLSSSVYQ